MPRRCYYHSCWAWSSILKVLKVISLEYLYNISKKKLGREFIFCMQMNIKVSTSWDYSFWWKWPDMSKVPKNVFYCDAKHSDILWGPSHVYCYILVSLHSQTKNFLPKGRNTIIKEHLCCHLCFRCSKLMLFNRSGIYCSISSYVHQKSQKNFYQVFWYK